MDNRDPLKSFIIGTSIIVVLHFYLSVRAIDDKDKNYSYEDYTIVAPLYIGLMNMFSVLLANQFNWSLRERLFYISILSGLIVSTFSTLSGAYNFKNQKGWYMYYLKIMLKHMFTYNGIIYLLEKHLS